MSIPILCFISLLVSLQPTKTRNFQPHGPPPPDIQSDKLYAVGRLDRDTTGLLLLTDNGPLGFQLLHPQYHVDKTYQVELNGLLTPAHIQTFQKGIVFLDGTVCKPAKLEILSASSSLSRASITISEGKFHQVKKMFLSVDVKVTSLKRIQFGDFTLNPDLAEGNYRPLNQKSYKSLKLLVSIIFVVGKSL